MLASLSTLPDEAVLHIFHLVVFPEDDTFRMRNKKYLERLYRGIQQSIRLCTVLFKLPITRIELPENEIQITEGLVSLLSPKLEEVRFQRNYLSNIPRWDMLPQRILNTLTLVGGPRLCVLDLSCFQFRGNQDGILLASCIQKFQNSLRSLSISVFDHTVIKHIAEPLKTANLESLMIKIPSIWDCKPAFDSLFHAVDHSLTQLSLEIEFNHEYFSGGDILDLCLSKVRNLTFSYPASFSYQSVRRIFDGCLDTVENLCLANIILTEADVGFILHNFKALKLVSLRKLRGEGPNAIPQVITAFGSKLVDFDMEYDSLGFNQHGLMTNRYVRALCTAGPQGEPRLERLVFEARDYNFNYQSAFSMLQRSVLPNLQCLIIRPALWDYSSRSREFALAIAAECKQLVHLELQFATKLLTRACPNTHLAVLATREPSAYLLGEVLRRMGSSLRVLRIDTFGEWNPEYVNAVAQWCPNLEKFSYTRRFAYLRGPPVLSEGLKMFSSMFIALRAMEQACPYVCFEETWSILKADAYAYAYDLARFVPPW